MALWGSGVRIPSAPVFVRSAATHEDCRAVVRPRAKAGFRVGPLSAPNYDSASLSSEVEFCYGYLLQGVQHTRQVYRRRRAWVDLPDEAQGPQEQRHIPACLPNEKISELHQLFERTLRSVFQGKRRTTPVFR